MTDHRRGLTAGVIDTLLWGSTVLYWPRLKPAGDWEILGHRLVWAFLFMIALLCVSGRFGSFIAIFGDRRTAFLLVGASLSITVNWAGFIWAVNHGHVVEASLGFFMSPLITVLFGVLVLHEYVRPWQIVAITLVGAAVVMVTIAYGRVPWFGLMLAISGGLYGLCKKQARTGALESLGFETFVVAPFALIFLLVEASAHGSTFTTAGTGHALLLVGGGIVTVTPLIFFGYAASRVSLVLLGIIGYLAPIGTFVLGLLYFHESLPLPQLAGYALVWLALMLFAVDSVMATQRTAPVTVEITDRRAA